MLHESLVTLPEASEIAPGSPHLSTLRRWCSRGIRGRVLETVLIGGRRWTSREALERFFTALSMLGETPVSSPTTRSRTRQIDKAVHALSERLGIECVNAATESCKSP